MNKPKTNKRGLTGMLLLLSCVAASPQSNTSAPLSERKFLGLISNGPAIFARYEIPPLPTTFTNSEGRIIRRPVPKGGGGPGTNVVFQQLVPGSLNDAVWTNFFAHTNGRTTRIWSERSHPPDWPTNPPVVRWDAACLMWGMKGITALSPCWEVEGAPGQVPVTALTRRHAYARGHGLGDDGFTTNFKGKKVWFVTVDNKMIEVTVTRGVVRNSGTNRQDYTILLLKDDLPPSIQPLRVVAWTNLLTHYPFVSGAPWPFLKTEQGGHVSAEIPDFTVNTWKGGDSGAPNMLPLPIFERGSRVFSTGSGLGELIFCSGRSTSPASPQMQADMDELCRLDGLDPKKYQLQWTDLSDWPSYSPAR